MQLIKTEDIDVYYVSEDQDISIVIDFCLSYNLLAVDTETKVDLNKLNSSALDPHSANISLVQVNSIDNSIPYLLDFLLLSKKAKELFNEKVLMNKDIRKIIHYACLPKETEVLTPLGWKNITEINSGDIVMGYENGFQVWTKVIDFIDAGVKDLFTIGNQRRQIIATKEHRHLSVKRTGKNYKGRKEFYVTTEEIQDLLNKNQNLLLHSAPANLTSDLFSKDELALLAWIWGDGCISKTIIKNKAYYQTTITQSSLNHNYCNIIEALLIRLNIPIKYYKLKKTEYIYRYNIPINFIRELYNRLNLELDSTNYNLFILNSSLSSIKSFAEHFYYAEGNKSREHYYCQYLDKNKEKSDCIALVGHLLGYTPYQAKKYVDFNKPTTTFRRLKIEYLTTDNTYCLNTETSNFVIRQNNFITLTGNSFDLKQFYNEFKTWPVNVWCTQTLMKSLGITVGMKASLFRGHSLKDMSRDYFDIILDKTEATSSWGERPLKLEQLGYAGLDVGAPKNSKYKCLLLEGYHLFKDQLDLLDQQIAYESDQQAVLICAKMEYEGMYVDKDILTRILNYAQEQTNIHRKYLVEELGFTIYSDTELNEEGEWELVQVIPDKIKTLLNNNKGLVSFINQHITKKGEQPLTSLQADEVKVYLDNLEIEADENKIIYDEDFLNYKYESINLIKNLLRYKKYNKLVSECTKYFDVINKNTSRVHAGFVSVGSSTGRMSSSGDANLQQASNTNVTISIDKHQF